MTFTSSQQENTVTESSEHAVESIAPVYVEDAPCIIMRAVNIDDTQSVWRPRTMHAWLT